MTSNTQIPYQFFLELSAFYLAKISFLGRGSNLFSILPALVSSRQYSALQWLLHRWNCTGGTAQVTVQHSPINKVWSETGFEIVGFGTTSVIRIQAVAE